MMRARRMLGVYVFFCALATYKFIFNGVQTSVDEDCGGVTTNPDGNSAQRNSHCQSQRKSNTKNTMIIAAYPDADLRLTAIWSQLECFTSNVDKIVLSVPDLDWSHDTMKDLMSQVESNLPKSLYEKISVKYYNNDRYDAGLWCDALQEEHIGNTTDDTNYLLINDSIMAIRHSDELLNSLMNTPHISFVSLSYWTTPYWLESIARAFSSRGIQIFQQHICSKLDRKLVNGCAHIGDSKKRKRCIVEFTEINVAGHYNRNETWGLYPGRAPDSMMLVSGTHHQWHPTPSWSGHYPFWKNILVDQMHFPAVKISHGFLGIVVPEEDRFPLQMNCTFYKPIE